MTGKTSSCWPIEYNCNQVPISQQCGANILAAWMETLTDYSHDALPCQLIAKTQDVESVSHGGSIGLCKQVPSRATGGRVTANLEQGE